MDINIKYLYALNVIILNTFGLIEKFVKTTCNEGI